jgi:hypothetical protein
MDSRPVNGGADGTAYAMTMVRPCDVASYTPLCHGPNGPGAPERGRASLDRLVFISKGVGTNKEHNPASPS